MSTNQFMSDRMEALSFGQGQTLGEAVNPHPNQGDLPAKMLK